MYYFLQKIISRHCFGIPRKDVPPLLHFKVCHGLVGLAFLLMCALPFSTTVAETRIVGGTPTTTDQFPWIVYLDISFGSAACGGTLIASEWVLTAAHCIPDTNLNIVAILGHDSVSKEQIKVDQTFPHQYYAGYDNDIALLHLSWPSAKTPIPSISDNAIEGFLATIVGYGIDEYGKFGYLNRVEVPITSDEVCSQFGYDHGYIVTNNEFCAGVGSNYTIYPNSCSGDSGGPVMVYTKDGWSQIGIVSLGLRFNGCGTGYSVYTRIWNYLNWIKQTISAAPPPPPTTTQEKSDAIFNVIEASYSQLFSPPQSTSVIGSGEEIVYYRFYNNQYQGVLATYRNYVWYRFSGGDWQRYSTLDEANKFLCNNQCW